MSKRSFIVAFKLYNSKTVRKKKALCRNAIMVSFEYLEKHGQP